MDIGLNSKSIKTFDSEKLNRNENELVNFMFDMKPPMSFEYEMQLEAGKLMHEMFMDPTHRYEGGSQKYFSVNSRTGKKINNGAYEELKQMIFLRLTCPQGRAFQISNLHKELKSEVLKYWTRRRNFVQMETHDFIQPECTCGVQKDWPCCCKCLVPPRKIIDIYQEHKEYNLIIYTNKYYSELMRVLNSNLIKHHDN